MQCQKHSHPAVEHAQNFAKFVSLTHEIICCNFFTISARGAPNFASSLRGFRFESRTTSAQLQCKSVPCGVPKKPRVRRLRIFFFHQKIREFIANSPRGRHALHRNFGRRRCENMLTLKNFCIALLTWCAPKNRRLNRAFGATIKQISHRKRANSLQIFCAVDVQRTRISAGVAAKTF